MCPEQDSNLHAFRHAHLKRARLPFRHLGIMSGKRDSNSRPRPWQGRALPTELFPRHCLSAGCQPAWLSSAQQTLAFQTSLPLQAASGKRDSNSRPRPWQGRALPTELFPLFNFGCKYTAKTIQCKSQCKKTHENPRPPLFLRSHAAVALAYNGKGENIQ